MSHNGGVMVATREQALGGACAQEHRPAVVPGPELKVGANRAHVPDGAADDQLLVRLEPLPVTTPRATRCTQAGLALASGVVGLPAPLLGGLAEAHPQLCDEREHVRATRS